jgi:hypothetical protein
VPPAEAAVVWDALAEPAAQGAAAEEVGAAARHAEEVAAVAQHAAAVRAAEVRRRVAPGAPEVERPSALASAFRQDRLLLSAPLPLERFGHAMQRR